MNQYIEILQKDIVSVCMDSKATTTRFKFWLSFFAVPKSPTQIGSLRVKIASTFGIFNSTNVPYNELFQNGSSVKDESNQNVMFLSSFK